MNNKEPYFFNPNLSTEELEDWLRQQRMYLAHYNRLKVERAALIEQLSQIDETLKYFANAFAPGKLQFPWNPSPLLKMNQE
ncbi:hypothetical protein ACWWJF_10185 [Symbiopectobacterium sp. Eva_TO]